MARNLFLRLLGIEPATQAYPRDAHLDDDTRALVAALEAGKRDTRIHAIKIDPEDCNKPFDPAKADKNGQQ